MKPVKYMKAETKTLICLTLGIIMCAYWGISFGGVLPLTTWLSTWLSISQISILEIACSATGLILGIGGLKSTRRTLAITGLVLCSLSLLLSLCIFLIGLGMNENNIRFLMPFLELGVKKPPASTAQVAFLCYCGSLKPKASLRRRPEGPWDCSRW
jgi:hypothetical protein